MYQTIELERRDDKIVVVRMVRESEMNTLAPSLVEELHTCLDELRWSPDCRVLVLTGQGKVFSAGAELKTATERDAITVREYMEKALVVFDKLECMPQATIAAINGFALGGGCELALACDFRIASEKAKLGFPEVTLGALPGGGGVQRLPRLVGKAKATELVLLGKQLSAAEAERVGIITKHVPADRVLDESIALGQQLLKNSPVAIHFAKSCLQVACDADLQTANRYAIDAIALCFASRDQKESVRAFFERRKPDFPGFAAHFAVREE